MDSLTLLCVLGFSLFFVGCAFIGAMLGLRAAMRDFEDRHK